MSEPGALRTAVVIGGSSELAEAVLSLLVPRGLEQVVLCGRDQGALAGVATRLRLRGLQPR